MGLYINVPDKLARLASNRIAQVPATHTATKQTFDDLAEHGNLALCAYCDNGSFDVIAVLFNRAEAQRFVQGRPDAYFYTVHKDKVLAACPEAKEALRA